MGELKLASAGHDIRLWDCNGFSLVKQFNPHNNNVCSLQWAHDNSTLVSASTGGDKIVLTYVNQAYYTYEFAVEENRTCVALTSMSRYLLGGGPNGHINIWDLKTKKMRKTYKDHKAPITCLNFNYNDTDIASGAENGEIIMFNVLTGQGSSPMRTAKASAVRQLKYNHFRHSMLGSVSDDGCVNVWDTNKRSQIHSFSNQHKAPATGLAFSPLNEMLLISVGLDKRVICFDVRSCQQVRSMTAESPLTAIDVASDGGTVAVGSTRGKVYIYDLRQCVDPVTTMAAHKSSVQALTFQNDLKPAKSAGNGSSHVNVEVTKKPMRKLPSTTKLKSDAAIKPMADINANQTTPSQEYKSQTIEDGSNFTTTNPERKSNEFNEIFSPLRETNQRPSYGEAEKSQKSINNSNQSTDADGIYSPVRAKQSDRESGGVSSVSITASRPWAQSASRTPHQVEPTIPSRIPQPSPDQNDQQSNSSSRSESVSQDDQDFNEMTPGLFSRQSSTASNKDATVSPQPSQDMADNSSESQPVTPSVSVSRRGQSVSDSDRTARTEASPLPEPPSQSIPQFQMQLVRNLVEEAMEDVREELRRDVLNMHMEMIKLFQMQQAEMRQLLEQYSVNGELMAEIELLKEENKRLKQKY